MIGWFIRKGKTAVINGLFRLRTNNVGLRVNKESCDWLICLCVNEVEKS